MSEHNHASPEAENQMRLALSKLGQDQLTERLGPNHPLTQRKASEEQPSSDPPPQFGGPRLPQPDQVHPAFDPRRRFRRFAQDGDVPVSYVPRTGQDGSHREQIRMLLASKQTVERERDDALKDNFAKKEMIERLRTRVAHTEQNLAERDQKIANLEAELAKTKSELVALSDKMLTMDSRNRRDALQSSSASRPIPHPSPSKREEAHTQSVDRIAAFTADDPDSAETTELDEARPMPLVVRRRGRTAWSKNNQRTLPRESAMTKQPKIVEWWRPSAKK